MERLGGLAAEVLDVIEAQEIPEGAAVRIGTVAIVVELHRDEADGEGLDKILTRCTDHRRWLQQGLFDVARRAVAAKTEFVDDEDEE